MSPVDTILLNEDDLKMTQLSVIEVADLYGFNRQTIYKRIAKGELSKNSDGKIDFAEAIRVFGEPAKRLKENTPIDILATQSPIEVDILREQVDMLKDQLRMSAERERAAKDREDTALEREQFYQNQIEAMQRLLEAPKAPAVTETTQDANSKTNEDPKNDLVSAVANEENKDKQEPSSPLSEAESNEQKKKGFWSSFFG